MEQVESVLSDLIRINTVNPPGNETAVAVYLKNLFDAHGIQAEIIEGVPNRGNVIAHVGDGDRRLLYMAHTDVVPVTEGWSFPPFSGEIIDGFVHGRGALDCKGLVAVEACALINVAREKKLNGRLIFAACADEEAGGAAGAAFLVKNHLEKIRADFAVNEGAEPMTIAGKEYHNFSVGEKGGAGMRLRAKGIAGHSSVPVLANNAVVKMSEAICGLARYKPRITLTPETRSFIKSIAGILGIPVVLDEAGVDAFIRELPDIGLAYYLSAITRITVSPNIVTGGIRLNITPDSCEAAVDMRALPGQTRDYILNEFKEILKDVEVVTLQPYEASFSSIDTEGYKVLERILKDTIGDIPVLPTICPACTDSRYLRWAGIPTYGTGVMALNLDPRIKGSVHGMNEKIDVASLQLKTEFLTKLALAYLNGS